MPLVNGRVCITTNCGKCGHEVQLQSGSGGSYCPSCATLIFSSGMAKKFVEESQVVIKAEKERFGLSYEYTENCELCGEPYGSNLYMVDGNALCPKCYNTKTVECSGCKSRHMKRSLKNGLCDTCQKSFKVCPTCEHTYDIRKSRVFTCDDGKVRCANCVRHYLDAMGLTLRSYSFKPTPHFFGDLDDKNYFHMGVELELTNSTRLNEFMARSFCPEIYYKSDGSIHGWSLNGEGSGGVEVVTHPCTLEYHMGQFPWDRLLSAAKSTGFRGHTGSTRDKASPVCGLHVHASTTAFGRTQKERDAREAKLLVLVDKYWDKLVIFSRRDKGSLERWAKKYSDIDISSEDLDDIIKKSKSHSSRDRFMAVNLCNSNGSGRDNATVEFRMFRSTTNKETILATLQLVYELIDTTNLSTSEVQALTWTDFCNKVCDKYSEFRGYIERLRGMKRKI